MLARRLLAGTATAMLIGAGSVVATAGPAMASDAGNQQVCNSINSVGYITVWSTGAWWPERDLARGACATFDHQGTIRVDVDPEICIGGCPPDVDSYYIGTEGQGYGKCHQGENTASDPPYDPGLYVKYNTNQGSC